MELWDAYDENFNIINGVTLVRGDEIPKGMFHLVCETAVRHTDGTYLLMQRDFKKHLGGLWELTAGGSTLKGETPLQCVRRELSEETGINADVLTQIGTVVSKEHNSIYFEYLCVADCKKDSIALQPGETVGYRWVSVEEFKAFPSDSLATTRIFAFIEEMKA